MSVHWHDSVPSTMTLAAQLAGAGAPHMTTVAADEQTAGQGRLGRSWHSAKGDGLYVSIILRLSNPLPLVTLALGLATQRALRDFAGLATDLRWPNDVMVGQRKLAGILTQMSNGAVIAGIGINVNHAAFPAELVQIATSLRIESGSEHSPRGLLEALLPQIERSVAVPPAETRREFEGASSYARGKHVLVEERNLEGVTAGLDKDGFLLVEDRCGKVHTIVAGGVRAARA